MGSARAVFWIGDFVTLVTGLIIGPLIAGLLLFCTRSERARSWVVGLAVVAVAAGTLLLAWRPDSSAPGLAEPLDGHWFAVAMFCAELAMAAFIAWVGLRQKRPMIVLLILAQASLLCWLEWTHAEQLKVGSNVLVDKFTVIMALINGLVGGGICLYALQYMRGYQASHPEVADKRPMFFSVLFIFMGAMFGILFSNNLLWLFFFWEITTLCSFLLIGYTQTEEARNNALRALVMNLAGGLAFAVAIVWLFQKTGSIDMAELIRGDKALVLLPAALLCFAGITKSAQLPFSSWLLGAMVAPTPVSALLHSSTMVKAGVYLVLRMAPVVTGTRAGLMVALVGAITFVAGAFAAITARDAKRVLAWSTVSNLGLIVLCGGIGTYAAVWAGVLLIVFHAIAKCLLFLCVGLVEHRIHSRDIESMSGLILNMPKVAIMMLIGMAGMFLAPFGMLISKWAVLKAVVDAYPSLSAFIAFGSAATLFFWVKWMGKLLEVLKPHEPVPIEFGWGEAAALYGLSATTFLTCLFFPLISSLFIEPYVLGVYGHTASMAHGNIVIMTIMMVLIMLFPLSFINYGRRVKVMDAYLGGANMRSSVQFLGSANETMDVALHNYYLTNIFSEAWLSRWGVVSCAVILVMMVVFACL